VDLSGWMTPAYGPRKKDGFRRFISTGFLRPDLPPSKGSGSRRRCLPGTVGGL
jgi:hypothetical protein